MVENRQWILKRRPNGAPQPEDFEFVQAAIPEPDEGQFLARVLYLSLDPAQRIGMSDRTQYSTPVKIGDVMRGMGLSVVEKSRHPAFRSGDIVRGPSGWQSYWMGDAAAQNIGTPKLPLPAYISVLGLTGWTAYFGMLDVAKPKLGETAVISAAAGAVGSIAGQIAKLQGCRTVGVAGSEAKCRHVVDQLGFDACVNHRAGDFAVQLARACPDGIDVDFENVGGKVLDAVLEKVNLHARIAICGLISQYNATGPEPGPHNFANILMKRVTVQGFIVSDYFDRLGEFQPQMEQWLAAGKIRYDIHLERGIENMLSALGVLFSGDNVGKVVLQVSDL